MRRTKPNVRIQLRSFRNSGSYLVNLVIIFIDAITTTSNILFIFIFSDVISDIKERVTRTNSTQKKYKSTMYWGDSNTGTDIDTVRRGGVKKEVALKREVGAGDMLEAGRGRARVRISDEEGGTPRVMPVGGKQEGGTPGEGGMQEGGMQGREGSRREGRRGKEGSSGL